MKSVEVKNANATLRQYATELSEGPLVLLRGGKAIAALVRIRPADLESFLVSESSVFKGIVKRSRASFHRDGGLTRAEMEKRLEARRETRAPDRGR